MFSLHSVSFPTSPLPISSSGSSLGSLDEAPRRFPEIPSLIVLGTLMWKKNYGGSDLEVRKGWKLR
jgi:hypothetical protein